MSDLFTVSDEVINPKDRNRPFKLNNDLLKGFKDSAENGQIRLALEYLMYMFDIVSNELEKNNNEKKPAIKVTANAEVIAASEEASIKKTKKQDQTVLEA